MKKLIKKLMDLFSNKDRKSLANIAAVLTVGLILLVMSSSLFQSKDQKTDQASTSEDEAFFSLPAETTTQDSYEARLEKRLEDALSQVEGAGKVKALLTISYGREIVVAENITVDGTTTRETDRDGGSREVTSERRDQQMVILSDGGNSSPLILKEISPKIEGVILVAQGGDDLLLKDALIKAASTVLGVEPHRVQVLKMK